MLLAMRHNEKEIRGFFDKYRFLSNFHLVDIEYEGLTYPSTENAFQAAKSIDPEVRKKFTNISPKDAKALGKKIELRKDWEKVKQSIMYNLNFQKYSEKNEELMYMLVNTGAKYLEETNSWNDKFWGVCDGEGQNVLGIMLMVIRGIRNITLQNELINSMRSQLKFESNDLQGD